ncbi:hypothetical protein GC56T3_0225 [Geobacillus sp. C56-T3]|nr:hypothetical protein GC56T3_0225 [Geobacillus sp. C56-T3]ADU92740.1 hypothetical protein GYMC52_0228 [Geobacillus sp. Y412MC52]
MERKASKAGPNEGAVSKAAKQGFEAGLLFFCFHFHDMIAVMRLMFWSLPVRITGRGSAF